MESRDMKIKPIPDEPIILGEKNDLLGTYQYVESLKRIIKDYDLEKSDKKSYTIGLFGPWGSGKSSIIKTLEKEINNDEENICFFTYCVDECSKTFFENNFVLQLREVFGLRSKIEKILFQVKKNIYILFKTCSFSCRNSSSFKVCF